MHLGTVTDQKTVLVVEDDRSLSAVISKKLEIENFRVLKADSVPGALQCLEEEPEVDAIWLDHYLLGDENGLDLLMELKSMPKFSNIPIYVVSNTASDDKVRTYIKFGVEKYYVKSDHRLGEIIGDISRNLKISTSQNE